MKFIPILILSPLIVAVSALPTGSVDYLNGLDGRDALGYNEDLPVRNLNQLEERTGIFAELGPGGKNAAKAFLNSATRTQLSEAAAGGDSAKTVHTKDGFHLDRQQPSTERYKSKVAVQLNKPLKGTSTVGQVVVPHKVTPKPGHTRALLKESISKGKEITAPETKKAANIRKGADAKAAKAARVAQNNANGQARAKGGEFKKGQGKASAKFTPMGGKGKGKAKR